MAKSEVNKKANKIEIRKAVEELFALGLLKVLFATETFSVPDTSMEYILGGTWMLAPNGGLGLVPAILPQRAWTAGTSQYC